MGVKQNIREALEKITGRKIYKILPIGVDEFADIKRFFPKISIDTILDIGANVGMSASHFADVFPHAKIYSFEPAPDTFTILKARTKKLDNVKCFNLAVGSSIGEGVILRGERSDMNKVVPVSETITNENQDRVKFISLNEVFDFEALNHINYLKIDTEGHDIQVLQSGDRLLKESCIDFISVECSMNEQNQDHIPLRIFQDYFFERGYSLFAVYKQLLEWKHQKKYLRRTNPLFVSNRLI